MIPHDTPVGTGVRVRLDARAGGPGTVGRIEGAPRFDPEFKSWVADINWTFEANGSPVDQGTHFAHGERIELDVLELWPPGPRMPNDPEELEVWLDSVRWT